MPDAILYCDNCARLVPPSDISDGHAIITSDGAVCAKCASALAPEERAALAALAAEKPPAAPPPAAGRPSTRQGTERRETRRVPPPSGRAVGEEAPARPGRGSQVVRKTRFGAAVWVFLAGGFAVGIAIALTVVAPSGEPEAPSLADADADGLPPAGSVTVSEADAAPLGSPADRAPLEGAASPARARLDAIRRMEDPSLGRYGEMRRMLVELAEELAEESARGAPDAPEAGEVGARPVFESRASW